MNNRRGEYIEQSERNEQKTQKNVRSVCFFRERETIQMLWYTLNRICHGMSIQWIHECVRVCICVWTDSRDTHNVPIKNENVNEAKAIYVFIISSFIKSSMRVRARTLTRVPPNGRDKARYMTEKSLVAMMMMIM